MKLFKTASQEIHQYSSDLDFYSLKLQMKERFTHSCNLQGKFNNQYEFESWPIGDIAYVRKYQKPHPLVYIKGELIPNGAKTEVIICLVSYTVWVPVICSIITGLFGFFRFTESNNISILIVSIVLLFIFPFFLFHFINNQRERLKRNFSQTFGFRHVKVFENSEASRTID